MFSDLKFLNCFGDNMLYRVIGPSGSGKTEYILASLGKALEKGKKCFVIVPEQQSVDYEGAICQRFGDGCNLLCEVLNFERLPNRIARDFGGLAVNNMDKGGACALLSLVAEELKPQLKEYSALSSDPDFAMSVFTLISRMKMALITPDMITDSLKSGILESDERLMSKLHDIGLIYAEYEKSFGNDVFDPKDALTRLGNELPSKPFFKDACVFIDSYYTFTEQEYAVIKEIISQSSDTYISFTLDQERSFFDENFKSSERIKKLALGKCENIYLGEPKRYLSDSIAFIERNLWKKGFRHIPDNDGSVKLISAKNRFDEVEAAASEILDFVRQGGRYKDITLLTGNPDNYRPIVDSVFSHAGIPCYMSSKEPLYAKPLFAFLLSSLGVINEDFSLKSMKRYIKSGFTQLNISESDAILNYASSWNLRGKAWYSDEDWTLDPEGYREGDLTPRGAKLLALANKARNKIVPSLSALKETLSQKPLTVSKGIRALYAHLMEMEADERLRENSERYLKQGDREGSEREIQLWKLLINIFNQLDSVCGNREVTPKRLQSLIKLMCDCYSLGAIPASADSVTFGDASLIRAGNSRMVLVLGVCDGEFPTSTSTGFFDRDEAVALEGAGLLLADNMDKQLNTSRFAVYSALSAPKEKLVLLSPRSEISGGELRPSTAWLSVKQMLPNVVEQDFDVNNTFYSPQAIAANFSYLEKGILKDSIENALISNNFPFFREVPQVCISDSRIDFNKDILNLSPSKFEKYNLCPFSFFGSYLLELKEKKQNEFSMPEIGNFVHKILDSFMRECVSTGSFKAPDQNERMAIISKLADEYFLSVIGKEAENDKKFMHTYGNMIKTIDFVAENLCNEFSQSKFVPSGFEFKIGLTREPDIPAIQYDVDGKKVFLRGSIDRVDTYEENGVKYVRVIDYKTYSKTFSADLVANGIDTQLLHYLFAYCEKTDSKPAGALYYTVALPNVQITGRESPEKIQELIAKSVSRSGIILENTDIAYAMSPDFSFIPVSKNSDGSFSKRCNNLVTEEGFNDLSESLKSNVESLAKEVFCGNMDIAPNDMDGKAEPCKYCSLADLCRSGRRREEDDDDEIHNESE